MFQGFTTKLNFQDKLYPTKSYLDTNAQAFITATGITDPTQQFAINNLVIQLKSYDLWNKISVIYPFIGGTATTHKFNLKDPRDIDASFRLSFSGGWTHSSNGALPNGTNAIANTYFIPSNSISNVNSLHLSYYSRTLGMGPFSISTSIGAYESPTRSCTIGVRRNDNNFSSANSDDLNGFNFANTNGTGFYISNRQSITSLKGLKNGIQVAQNTNTANHSLITFRMLLGAAGNSTGTGISSSFDNHECAFASIGDGLTDTEAANFYLIVQNYQSILNRQV